MSGGAGKNRKNAAAASASGANDGGVPASEAKRSRFDDPTLDGGGCYNPTVSFHYTGTPGPLVVKKELLTPPPAPAKIVPSTQDSIGYVSCDRACLFCDLLVILLW